MKKQYNSFNDSCIREQILDLQSQDVAETLTNLADTYLDQDRLSWPNLALSSNCYMRKGIDIHYPCKAHVLSRMAMLRHKQGAYEQAVSYFNVF